MANHNASSPDFDPYYLWLGIPPEEQPADHYRLLGISRFEAEAHVIESAADRQMNHVRTFQLSDHTEDSQRLLNELATARICLLNPDQKQSYDQSLRIANAANESPPDSDSRAGSKLAPLHRVEPQSDFRAQADADSNSTIGLADWEPAAPQLPTGKTHFRGSPHHAKRPLRVAHPAWKQPHWIAVIAAGVIFVLTVAFMLSVSFFTPAPRANRGEANQPTEQQATGVLRQAESPATHAATAKQRVATKTESPATDTAQALATKETAVREILKNALVIYNFEENTYAKEDGTSSYILQDLGPGDMWGRYYGELLFEDGIAGQAYVYDGIQQSTRIPELRPFLHNGRSELTVSFWQRTDSVKFGLLFDCGIYPRKALNIAVNPNGTITMNIGLGTSVTTSTPLPRNVWHHMVLVFRSVEVQLFVDGEVFETWEIPPTRLDETTIGAASTRIGGQSKVYKREERFFCGLIDEFAILPQALTTKDVKLLYEWTSAGNVLPTIPDDFTLFEGPPHGIAVKPEGQQ